MKIRLFSSIILTVFLQTNLCLSQELPEIITPTGEKDPGAAISPMKIDQKAPFTGVLLSPRAVSHVITELKSVDEKIKIEVEKSTRVQRALCKKDISNVLVEIEGDKKMLKNAFDLKSKEALDLQEQLKKEKEESPSRVLWTGVGVLGGVAVTILTVFAVNAASK